MAESKSPTTTINFPSTELPTTVTESPTTTFSTIESDYTKLGTNESFNMQPSVTNISVNLLSTNSTIEMQTDLYTATNMYTKQSSEDAMSSVDTMSTVDGTSTIDSITTPSVTLPPYTEKKSDHVHSIRHLNTTTPLLLNHSKLEGLTMHFTKPLDDSPTSAQNLDSTTLSEHNTYTVQAILDGFSIVNTTCSPRSRFLSFGNYEY